MDSYILKRREEKLKDKKPKKKGIPKMSAKRKVENKELKKIVDSMKLLNPVCMIKSPNCIKVVQGSHHIQKRSPKNLLDRKNILLSCNPCNSYLEAHITWGKERGFIKSKFA